MRSEYTMAIITKRRKAYSVIYQKVDKNGTKKTVWETYYDYRSAVARQKELEETIDYDKIHIDQDSKIVDFLKQYIIKVGSQKWSISRCEMYQGIVRNYLEKIFDNKVISNIHQDFGFQTMESLKKTPAQGKRHQKGTKYVPVSMQRCTLTLLRNAFDYLVTENRIYSNPFLDVCVNEVPKKSTSQEWNFAYVENLFRNAGDIRLFLLVQILFSTGLGINEVIGLAWENIHVDRSLIDSDQCYIRSDKILKRLNMSSISMLPESQIVQQFRYEGFNQTNTRLILMYKQSSVVRNVHLHRPVAMLLKEWREQQECYSSVNPNNLVITLGNGKPCDIRSLTKMYHVACENGKMKNLTLAKLKTFSTKKVDKSGTTNADYFYSHINEPIKIPDLQKNMVHVLTMTTNREINQKLKFDVFEKKNEDLQLLLHQLQDNAELKMQLINRIKAEL